MATNAERITELYVQTGQRILGDARNALYLNMRYLDLALSALRLQITTELPGIGTDGQYLCAHPKILADLYERDRRLVNRVYLHVTMHCLLRHLFKRPHGDELLWNLACDIHCESIIDTLRVRSVWMGVSVLRREWYQKLKGKRRVLSAEIIYRELAGMKLPPYTLTRLKEEFSIDDHSLWPQWPDPDQPRPPAMQMLQNKWDDLSEKTQTEMETFAREQAEGDGSILEEIQAGNRPRTDYRGFLRKFAVLHEEMSVDPDSFDYVFYTYGLSLYGNMPLIEPQEQREVKKIREFVIVIDVSMSTSGELVRTFLDQTYAVLSESETYLSKVNIHILQCDEQVREDVKIENKEQMEEYMQHFTLKGGGGTDFRPAFEHVYALQERGELSGLKGMIYFTDGFGIYPKRMPPWDTAFVFMEEDYSDAQVPPWAMKLILLREDLEEEDQALRTDYVFLE
ncbi:MAG: VWA-like domain-containing protein [Lachnospiraceae bacterium]|nr:VWA-like domain-containing protein [Lachnospiraceae bacterium]